MKLCCLPSSFGRHCRDTKKYNTWFAALRSLLSCLRDSKHTKIERSYHYQVQNWAHDQFLNCLIIVMSLLLWWPEREEWALDLAWQSYFISLVYSLAFSRRWLFHIFSSLSSSLPSTPPSPFLVEDLTSYFIKEIVAAIRDSLQAPPTALTFLLCFCHHIYVFLSY